MKPFETVSNLPSTKDCVFAKDGKIYIVEEDGYVLCVQDVKTENNLLKVENQELKKKVLDLENTIHKLKEEG